MTKDKYGNRYTWHVIWRGWFLYHLPLWDADSYLDGGSRYWRFGPIEVEQRIDSGATTW